MSNQQVGPPRLRATPLGTTATDQEWANANRHRVFQVNASARGTLEGVRIPLSPTGQVNARDKTIEMAVPPDLMTDKVRATMGGTDRKWIASFICRTLMLADNLDAAVAEIASFK